MDERTDYSAGGAAARTDSAPPRVLLVDDAPQNLLALEAMLGELHLDLVLATSGEEALRCLLKSDFAVILLDVLMPGMDGLETAELIRARERSRDTPIIFVTAAEGDRDLVTRGYALGAVDYIVKPIQPAILRSKVAVFVDLFRKRAQISEQAAQLACLNAELEARVAARTAELQAAQCMAEQERDRLQQIVAVLPEGILIADAASRIVAMNQVAVDLFGVSAPQQPVPVDAPGIHRRGMARHLDGMPYTAEELPLERTLHRGETVRAEQFLLRNATTGRDLVVLASSAPLREADGSIGGAVTVFQDITAIKDLERQREAFVAMVSHDLKNPLTSILAMSQMLERHARRLDEPARARLVEGLETVSRAARRMTGQINELLDVTRLRMGQALQLEQAPVDVATLLARLVDEYQRTTEQHTLRLQIPEGAVMGMLDAPRLQRALANLLVNAIKFSPQGGEILTSLALARESDASWIAINIVDNGVGIPSADLPHVFEGFFRASNVAGRISGTGLGLAGVRQIVELHGGTIAIASEQGAGTTVTVRLPLAGQPD
jgi:signal transduction histidine kinase